MKTKKANESKNSKKKFVIALCSVTVVAICSIAALIGVLATFNANIQSGDINITYTATNVKATITASYGYDETASTIIKCGQNDSMVFSGAETDETVSQTFAGVTYQFTRLNKDIYLKYIITNDNDDSACTLSLTPTWTDSENNTTISYKVIGATTEDMTEYGEFPTGASIAIGGTCTIYVKVSMTNATKNVNLAGSLVFALAV